jgi:hypothetical protein
MKNFFRYHLFDQLSIASPGPAYVSHTVNRNDTGYCINNTRALSQIIQH